MYGQYAACNPKWPTLGSRFSKVPGACCSVSYLALLLLSLCVYATSRSPPCCTHSHRPCVPCCQLLWLQCLAAINESELDLSSPAWQAASPEARELVTVMLARDPAHRPSAQQLLDKYASWLKMGEPQQQ